MTVDGPGLYSLSRELESSPWNTMLEGEDGIAKLQSLFRDWSIAKALNDSSLSPPWGDDVTLGFKRGVSPYYDVGLFRDVDQSCCAFNSPVLPHEHTVADTSLNEFVWVTSYTDPSDIEMGDCYNCPCDPNRDGILTVAEKADPIDVRTWGSDYILFKPDSSLSSDGPYDLKVKIRGEKSHPPFNVPPWGHKLQATVLTYSSADSVFRSSDGLMEIRRVDINPDSAKANVTVCGFGGDVKAALIIVGLVYDARPGGPDSIPPMYVDASEDWNYKYGYTVEKHWKSGPIASSVAWFDSIHVSGDVTVPWNKTLTIEPGTRVEFYPGDTQHGGQDSNRSELILQNGWFMGPGGKLVAEGAPNDTILFTSGASSPGPFDWYGVRMLDDGSPFEAKYCRFESAFCPIVCTGDTLTVDSCLIRSFGGVGIYAGDTSVVSVEGTTIDMSSGWKGIQVVGGSTGVITGNRIVGSGGGAGVETGSGSIASVSHNTIVSAYTGIDAYGDSLSSSHNHISGFQNAGVKVSGGAASVSYDTLDIGSTGVSGIELVGSSPADVNHNVVTGSSSGLRYGIKSSGATSGSISYNRIENVLDGMKAYGNSDLEVERNVFEDNGTVGISVEGSADVGIKRNSITDYTYYGVVVKNSAHAGMGAQPDSGVNRIFTDSQLVGRYWVMNKTADTVKARYNWWGTDDPYFGVMMFYGKVDWIPYLTQDPGMPFALRMPGSVLGKQGAGYAVQNYPNPMNPVTTIEYGVPEDGTHVLVRVFDVSGRLVKTLVEDRELAGVHTVIWDGRGEDGRGIASGVYVYEAVIGEQRVAKKLVVLK